MWYFDRVASNALLKEKKLEDVIKSVSRCRIWFENVILVSRSGREQAFVSCKLVTKNAVISWTGSWREFLKRSFENFRSSDATKRNRKYFRKNEKRTDKREKNLNINILRKKSITNLQPNFLSFYTSLRTKLFPSTNKIWKLKLHSSSN